MLNIMTLGKVLQRHAYDILSHKYSVIIIFIAFSTLLISVFQFGEVWMTWSQEKYQAVFNSYSDNIVGKSLQNKLCQNVPIDVVYTWVNGSDPLLLQQLQEYQWQLQEETSKKCPHADCVPSHIITLRHWLSDDMIASDILPLIGIKDINVSLVQKVKMGNVNWTLIELNSPLQAAEAIKQVIHPNVTAYHAHWTSGSTAADIINNTSAIIVSGFPDDIMYEAGKIIHAKLTEGLQVEIQNFWIYPEKRLMIVMLDSAKIVNKLIQVPNNMTIGGRAVNISKANLIMELPLIGNSKDFSPSRFEDKEELRYSLRSLERFAPWVRHIYLVTNGQIPYWLDLENPRLTIITHDMIFPDTTHLPTFSSPAIESHLHRIPGLSGKFLYLNDDVMFGKEVWPDDFITNTNGQKVYLSWPVPDCSESCPWSWVADGSCDVSCNNSECSFDGGDCDLSTEDEFGIYDENRHLINYDDNDDFVPINENYNHAQESMYDNFFRNMNFGGDIVLEDLPDNGKRMNSLLDILIKKNTKNEQLNGNLTFFDEMEDLKIVNQNNNSYSNTGDTVTSNAVINNTVTDKMVHQSNSLSNQTFSKMNNTHFRRLAHSNISSYITSLPNSFLRDLFANTSTNLTSKTTNENTNNNYNALLNIQKLPVNTNLLGKTWNDGGVYGEYYPKLDKQEEKSITATKNNNKMLSPLERKTLQQETVKYKKKSLRDLHSEGETLEVKHNGSQNPYFITKSNQTYKFTNKLKSVKNSSYNIKFNKLYQKLNARSDEPDGKHQHSDYDGKWKIEERTSRVGNSAKKKQKSRTLDAQMYSVYTSPGKKPQDTFAASLLYVNRLFNQEFGFEPRKVPAHMPHLIDIDIMERLQARFSKEWHLTSSHKVRSAQDMQFAFSYFYFLMSSKEEIPVTDIFDTFDTDQSGTWSDREIRTLLTRSFELPLNYARVIKFENYITNCSRDLPEELSDINISTPPYERYQDSKLPVVTKKLISNCKPIVEMLKKKFGTRKLYQYHVERDKHQEISFKMLNSNISQLISHLDDIRRDPKKFVCLNDNLDPERAEDNAIAKAILQDMYESLFPKPSTFELPPEFRNRFLHINELQAWRRSRNTVRTIVYICLAILIAFTLVNFFHIECRWLQRKLFSRARPQQSSSLVPCV